MPTVEELFTDRKSLDEICSVPEKMISVYSLEKHVWADSNSLESRKNRKPELKTIEEFQIEPVRPFLNDILRKMAAPYKPERKDNPIGQGYWIQAEFGSGKSHLLCFLASLALGDMEAWKLIKCKEQELGRGKRESIYRFWEDGIEAKTSKGKGIFVIVKTLVGAGGGVVGIDKPGKRMIEYILDAASEQIQVELGKNLSLYPAELLADRFLAEDCERFRHELNKFLHDPHFFEEDEFEDVDQFIDDIQQNRSPQHKRSCGGKLWRFYTEYLKMYPQIPGEIEDILKHLVEAIMAEGYSGILLVLDEVSLFMKDRNEEQRSDDEKTLVVLTNRMTQIHNLPIWTVCAAQQAIESKMGVKNIIADERLKLVKLLEEDKDYYEIVLSRVRDVKNASAIGNYYHYYKNGFTWPSSIGEQEFNQFFPFHKPALEVLRAITYELTTARSAIHFMHQTLKLQINNKGRELIRLWELFDEAVRYEEDPSGVHAGLTAIKTSREQDYHAYEICKRQVESITKGYLKVYRDKAIKTIQTLFLYHISRLRQQGLTPEEIANSVLIARDMDANQEENIQHYEILADNLKKELRQIVQEFGDDRNPLYRFDTVITGIDPRQEFQKARDDSESNEVTRNESWLHLLCLDEWLLHTGHLTIDLTYGVRSLFRDIAPNSEQPEGTYRDKIIEVNWLGRQVTGLVGMRDLCKVASGGLHLPLIDSERTELDFAVFVGTRPVSPKVIEFCLGKVSDPRVMIWTPSKLNSEEHSRLLDFAAYRRLATQWQGKESDDATAVINWVSEALKTELGTIARIVDNSYARGRIDAINNTMMDFRVAGEVSNIISPLVEHILTSVYESRDIRFDYPFFFRKEEGVKVINGIVKTGFIPRGVRPNQNISAVQNFGHGLKIMKNGHEKTLDTSDNCYVQDMWSFIEDKLPDQGQAMKLETLYKNFMGIGGPKDYGLTRRMVQIYLLCLVKQGKIRVMLAPGAKSGLSIHVIDYSNIEGIDFSVRVLESMMTVQKIEKPFNWEALRPYAEKLLQTTIPSTQDDREINKWRTNLRELFAQEKGESSHLVAKAKNLFDLLDTPNFYEQEVNQIANLFNTDLSQGIDIDMLLYGLKQTLGYRAYDTNNSSHAEVDDLAQRLCNYYDLKRFLGYDFELRLAYRYCKYSLPRIPLLKSIRSAQQQLLAKLNDLKPYIDSDIKVKTELIGQDPPLPGEKGTLGVLINEYTTVYKTLHDSVINTLEQSRKEIKTIIGGDTIRALKLLEDIPALRPKVSDSVVQELECLARSIFTCAVPSLTSVVDQLKRKPEHECGLSFNNADIYLGKAKDAVKRARELLDTILSQKLAVFTNSSVRERLQQGRDHEVIKKLLDCQGVTAIRAFLLPAVLMDTSIIKLINRYLKRVVVINVRVKDFRSSFKTIEEDQVTDLVEEFRRFIEDHFKRYDEEDVLPILQLE